MIESEDAAGVEGGLEGLGVGLAGGVLEQLVNAVAPLEHRVVLAARADQVREGELLAGEVKLDRVAEGDLEGVVLAAGAALHEELALLGDDQELGRFPRAPGELDDRVDDADVEVGEDDAEFFGAELLALSGEA